MIKVFKNHYHNGQHVVVDRIALYATREGLDHDINDIINYVEDVTGGAPKVKRGDDCLVIGNMYSDEHIVWIFKNI